MWICFFNTADSVFNKLYSQKPVTEVTKIAMTIDTTASNCTTTTKVHCKPFPILSLQFTEPISWLEFLLYRSCLFASTVKWFYVNKYIYTCSAIKDNNIDRSSWKTSEGSLLPQGIGDDQTSTIDLLLAEKQGGFLFLSNLALRSLSEQRLYILGLP